MKRHDYEYSCLKHKLRTLEEKGVPSVIWHLTPDKRIYIENTLGYVTEPYIFLIKTRTFNKASLNSALLKDIHYSRTRDKKSQIFRKLNFKEQKLLKENKICFHPIKYKIILRGN